MVVFNLQGQKLNQIKEGQMNTFDFMTNIIDSYFKNNRRERGNFFIKDIINMYALVFNQGINLSGHTTKE